MKRTLYVLMGLLISPALSFAECDGVKIIDQNWWGVSGGKSVHNFTIENNSSSDIKNITLICMYYGSGGDIGKKTLPGVIKRGKTKTFKRVPIAMLTKNRAVIGGSCDIESCVKIK